MRDVIHVVSLLAFFAWLTFVVTYAIRAKWWKKPEGRNVMGVALVLTISLGMINASYLWPDYAWRDYVVLAVYVGAFTFGVQRTVQMLRAQRRKRDTH